MAGNLRITRTKGGNLHPLSMQDFVIGHLGRVIEDYPANIHRAFLEELKVLAEQKGRRKPYHKSTYASFIVNFNKLVHEGLVEFSGREVRSDDPRAQGNKIIPMRKYFRLSRSGSTARHIAQSQNLPSVTSDVHQPVRELVDQLRSKRQFGRRPRPTGPPSS